MKIYQVLLLILCVIYPVTLYCNGVRNPSNETCKAGLTEEDKQNGDKYCCFVRYKRTGATGDEKVCRAITEYQYKNIDEYGKYYSIYLLGTDDYNIECGSIFFKFNFLSLILLLL